MPVRQVEQLITHRAFLAHGRNKPADFVFHTRAAGAFQRDVRCGRIQQETAALHGALKGIDHRIRPRMGAHLKGDGNTKHIARAAEVDDLGLGGQ
ncbi:hypothetical protein D3C81_1959970 [compost metagenome]